VFVPSTENAAVPLFIVFPKSKEPNASLLTLLTTYGGMPRASCIMYWWFSLMLVEELDNHEEVDVEQDKLYRCSSPRK
jgi:hypothetical protein